MKLFVRRIEEESLVMTYGGERVGPARVVVHFAHKGNEMSFHATATEWAVGDAAEVTIERAENGRG